MKHNHTGIRCAHQGCQYGAGLPWRYYRLGAMVISKWYRDRRQPEHPDRTAKELHYELYPDSIASQYMRETDDNGRLDILRSIIKKHPSYLKPKPEKDELVVHLRVGNVVEWSGYTVEELLEKKRLYMPKIHGNRCYVKPLSYYEQALNKIDRQVKKITLVAGGNLTSKSEKSKEYTQVIKNLFEKSGLDVGPLCAGTPDDDFVYMCCSKFFLQSGGDFSALVNSYRRKYPQNLRAINDMDEWEAHLQKWLDLNKC